MWIQYIGTVLLDLEKEDFSGIIDAVIEDLTATSQLQASDRNGLIKVLRLKHSHHHDHHSSSFFKYVGSVTHMIGDDENAGDEEVPNAKKSHGRKGKLPAFHWLRSTSHDLEASQSTNLREVTFYNLDNACMYISATNIVTFQC